MNEHLSVYLDNFPFRLHPSTLYLVRLPGLSGLAGLTLGENSQMIKGVTHNDMIYANRYSINVNCFSLIVA
jgi:hypothetical protein